MTVAFAPDGKTVITCNSTAYGPYAGGGWPDWSFRVWDVATGKELRVTEMDPGGRGCVAAISPDARRIAAVLHTGTIRLWDVATGKEVHHWKGPTTEIKRQVGNEWTTEEITAVRHATFTPDGKTFMTPGRNGTVLR